MQDAVQNRPTALPLRDHTILGVCEAIGEDFGFNPLLLRVPLAACVLVSIKYAIAAYLALALVVLASRLLFPNAKPAAEPAIQAPSQPGAADELQEDLPLAA